jgi:cold shock CspA family protein
MSLIGSVKFFDTKKGWGFITMLSQGLVQSNTEVFVHFTNLNVKENSYKRLYPGEYVSFNMGKNPKGQDTCIDVCGILGGPLLTDHSEHVFRIYPKIHRSSDRAVVAEEADAEEADADAEAEDAEDAEE